jgi:hypothetical protein
MRIHVVRRRPTRAIVGAVCAALLAVGGAPAARGSSRHIDPAQIVPLAQIAPEHRESVAETIRDHTFHRRGAPESFPCHARIYLSLLNEPAITLALWKDLSDSPVQLRRLGPNLYEGTDGAGTSATWQFVYRSPQLHVLLCQLQYTSPRGGTRLDGRIVLVVHTGYFREVKGEPWVRHDVEAYVKIDSHGWKTVARAVRPLLERVLEDQVQEAGWFVSLMGRLVVLYPNWAAEVTLTQADTDAETRRRFRDLVLQNRKPGASAGRPVVLGNSGSVAARR